MLKKTVKRKVKKKLAADPLDRKIRRLEERLREARHAFLKKHGWSFVMLGGTTLWFREASARVHGVPASASRPTGVAVSAETAISLQRAWSFTTNRPR